MVSDHAKINDEMKFRVNSSDKRYDDFVKQSLKKEEQLILNHSNEVSEIKHSLNKQFAEEIRRLNEQISEAKEKGKRKQGELQQQISEIVQKNGFESGQMKQTFEELMNNMQGELEAKKDMLN
jgi:hypothetical protein